MKYTDNLNVFRKTKIVATLGPASNTVEKMTEMIHAGLNCARFNFSHGNHKEHKERYDKLKEAMKASGKRVALLLDTKGPEIRTGDLESKPIVIENDTEIIVSGKEPLTKQGLIALSYEQIHNEVEIGMLIKIADGSIVLSIKKIEGTNVICHVNEGGTLSAKKNVNIPGAVINLPSVSSKDIEDIRFAIEHKYDYIAASFIRNAAAVRTIKTILEDAGSHISIIAKIENQEGLDNLESIIKIADGIMIARGDLAEQIPPEQVPLVQKRIIKYCLENKKIAITATQMLQSMEHSLTPTRAELTDVANAIFDGTDAVMLSGETAQGEHPVEAIQTMHRVGVAVEESSEFREQVRNLVFENEKEALFSRSDAGYSIIAAAQVVADKTNAAAFVCPSLTGTTPRLLATLKPSQPIVATTHLDYVYSKLLLYWGVCPMLTPVCKTDKELIETSIEKAKEAGFLKKNGKVVLIAGLPINKPLMINTIQVHFEGVTIARGRDGVGRIIQGKYYKVQNIHELERHHQKHQHESYIYSLAELSYSDLPFLKDIRAIVIEQASEVPMDTLTKQYPGIICITKIEDLTFQELKNEREIIISGNEQIIYEP